LTALSHCVCCDHLEELVKKGIFAISLAAACCLCLAQQPSGPEAAKPNVAQLLSALSSEDVSQRSEAYYRISSDHETLSDPRVRTALLNLLDRENRAHVATSAYDESYAEYKAALADTVSAIADWEDARQVCILAHTAYNIGSAFATKLASAGPLAVPCLVEMAESNDAANRYKAIPVLLQLRAVTKTLDSMTVDSIAKITIRGLQDHDEIVASGPWMG
jgi:hypothetical protein